MDSEHVHIGCVRDLRSFIEGDNIRSSAAFVLQTGTCVIDKNPAHLNLFPCRVFAY
jgi:hypothetical protein